MRVICIDEKQNRIGKHATTDISFLSFSSITIITVALIIIMKSKEKEIKEWGYVSIFASKKVEKNIHEVN